MGYFIIGYGLGGGFGGIQNYEVWKAKNKDQALDIAYEIACEEYETYFMHTGDLTVEEIMDEMGCSRPEAEEEYNDNREIWLEYSAEPFSKEIEEELEIRFNYTNAYKEQTNDL